MTLDIIIPALSLITGACLAIYLVKLKWFHLLAAVIFLTGSVFSALFGYFLFYPLLNEQTQWTFPIIIFVPAIISFTIWTFLFFRFFSITLSFISNLSGFTN